MTEQTPKTGNSPDADPRLLLPDWLRDDPPKAEAIKRDSPPADDPVEQSPMSHGVAEAEPDQNTIDSDSRSASTAAWQQPPPRVESYDPAQLIGAEDLPSWIRDLAERELPGPVAADDLSVPESTTEGSLSPALQDDREPAAVDMHLNVDESATSEDVPTSDLTETGFVLIAGAALVAIVAALALFYL